MAQEQLTTKAREALSDAIRRATTAGNSHVEPVHVLLALLAQGEGIATPLLTVKVLIRSIVARIRSAKFV